MQPINNNTLVNRQAHRLVERYLQAGKVVVIYGPRRVGKTTLLAQIQEEYSHTETILAVTGENIDIHADLSSRRQSVLERFVGQATLLIIDEAQLIPDIGRNLKLLVDTQPNLKIIASGSSAFDLAAQVGEPLVGRKWTVLMYPFSAAELVAHTNWPAVRGRLDEALIFGSYPDVWHAVGTREKRDTLQEIVGSYLYRDILQLGNVRRSNVIHQLLELLAFQIGHEVSISELSSALAVDSGTVRRYLSLLEEAFVLINIRGFSRNLRKEITKTSRYYFVDNGVRNSLINSFNGLRQRNDIGALWENWLVVERLKHQAYTSLHANNYFWRTYDQKEIDWVEERDGKLYGYEFSWQPKEIRKATRKEFTTAYPNSELTVIHQGNYQDFIL